MSDQTLSDQTNETLELDAPLDTWGTSRRLLGQMRNQRWRLGVVCVSIVFYTVFLIGAPLYSAVAVDLIWDSVQQAWHNGTAFAITWNGLGRPLAILAILYLLQWAFYYVQVNLMASVAEKLNLTLREQISAKLNRLPLSYFDSNKPGEVLSKTTSDLDRISEVLQTGLLRLLTAIGTIIGALAAMAYYSLTLTAVFLVFMLLSAALTRVVARKNLQTASLRQQTVGELTGIVEEYYQGRDVIKSFNHEEESLRTVTQAAERTRAVAQEADFLTNCVNPAVRMITRLSQVVIAVLAGRMMVSGAMSVGVAQAFFQYINLVAEPLTQASFMANSLQSTLASAERTFALLDETEERPDPNEPVRLPEVRETYGRITFEHVSFGYETDRTLMEDISFVAEPSQKIAIVGSTGAGKTTLINLLMRFYEIDGGRITIDGINTADMTRADVRGNFGMVLQDTWLFGGTVAENLAYGKPGATRDEIVAAAKAVKADYFIRTLPQGYDTVLSNEANNLSVGQRQLLTIARVFLCDPPVLILDEATSSVDTRTEAQIGKAMANLMHGRTSFVIAHRLSTIRDADMILFMEHGTIVEQGTHDELVRRGGPYSSLYYSQFA
jgi:ATP-binding cassette subfamily B protein